ncbi:hypothetical protein ACHAP7_011472 [Fusarium lateritium]
MASSTNSAMFRALDNFLDRFHSTESGRGHLQRPLFGHIRIPNYRLEGLTIVEYIRQTFEETAPLFFVTSELEKQLGSGLETDCQVLPVTMNFGDLIQVIRKDLADRPYPMYKLYWDFRKRSGDTWGTYGRLPGKLVIVLLLDPTVPADCALSLACLVEWALAASNDQPSHIRVLTMSAEDDGDFLSTLVASSKQPSIPVSTVDLASHGLPDPFENCLIADGKDDENIAAEILNDIRNAPEIKRIVVSFNPNFAASLNSLLGSAEADLIEQRELHDNAVMSYIERLSTQPATKTVVVTIRGQLPFLPPQLTAFDGVRIVLGYSDDLTPAWYNHTCQVVSYPHHLSRSHRVRQAWWAYQRHKPVVTIHPGIEGLDAFAEDEFSSIRKIESEQLGGFIAAVADLTLWGFDVDNIIGCFVRYPLLAKEMKSRLATQKLVVRNRIILSETERKVFRTALPHVKYDHRVALFLALDSRPDVYRVKAQLAALFTFDGWSNIARLRRDDSSDILFGGLWGLGKSLAPSGDMWLILGLYKAHRKIIDDHGMYNAQHDKLNGIVSVSKQAVARVRELATTLTGLILGEGCSINAASYISTETEDLSDDCQRQLQSHLFRAYMHQVTACYWPKIDGKADTSSHIHSKLLSTMAECQVSRNSRAPTSLVKIVSLLDEEEAEYVFGISHQFFRVHGSSSLWAEDWTQIPKGIIAE